MKTFFSFDDHAIPFRSNLDLTLLPGVKYAGNPVLKRGKPGAPDARWARLWAGTVLRDEDKFRMWYSGAGSIEEWMGLKFPMLYAESNDGINWTKPNLKLKAYRGSRDNNLVDIEYPVEMPAVMRDDGPDVPADERYKMFSENLYGSTATPFLATSADGLRWKIVGHPKHRGVSLYRFNGQYHSAFVMYTSELPGGYPGGRVMGVIRSVDWQIWTGEPCLGFHRANYFNNPPDIGDQVHTPAGFWNRDNVILGVYGQIHQVNARPGAKFARLGSGMEDTREDLGLFLSNDGLHFREPIPGFKIVARSQEGHWDGGSVVPANAFVNVGEHTYLYYGAWDNGMCFDNAAGDVGMAFWRRDGFGFVRIRKHDQPATMQTEPIAPNGKDRQVFVNFELDAFRPGCGLSFELVDLRGKALAGYSADDCVTCMEPGLCRPVRWKDRNVIGKEVKEPVELRVVFVTNGDMTPYQEQCTSPMLYAIYVADQGEIIE
ncbi:MAG: hypothetical protein HY360_08225 [Verrucomicrobia bacterium]|nr:hypothetical protein [Verrucomicrobiota bacterium]